LATNEQLRQSYVIYQDLLDIFDAKDFDDFYQMIDTLPFSIDSAFKKSILYLRKYRKIIINSLKFSYSNDQLEGKNNRIKVINQLLLVLEPSAIFAYK
jgi:transposase